MARPKVLAVDDDPRITKLIKANMETDDVEVAVANSGADCMRILQEASQDLVLLDLELPDCSGWDILATIRSTEILRTTAVVIISVDPPDETKIRRFGADGYLQKPFDVRKMLTFTRSFLADRERSETYQPSILVSDRWRSKNGNDKRQMP